MKILIGYDGSEHSDAAIDDLKLAGLPRDSEILIASVADRVKTISSCEDALTNRRTVSRAPSYASVAALAR